MRPRLTQLVALRVEKLKARLQKKNGKVAFWSVPNANLIASMVAAAAAAGAAVIGFLQFQAMQGQLDVMQGQLSEMKSSGVQADKSLAAFERMAEASKTSNSISEKALSASNRPWVGVTHVVLGDLKIGQEGTLRVIVKNAGRSPALNVRGCVSSGTDHSATQTVASIRKFLAERKGCQTLTQAVVLPDAAFVFAERFPASMINALTLKQMEDATLVLVVLGMVDYEDAFGIHHQTTYCGRYFANLKDFAGCDKGNNAN